MAANGGVATDAREITREIPRFTTYIIPETVLRTHGHSDTLLLDLEDTVLHVPPDGQICHTQLRLLRRG